MGKTGIIVGSIIFAVLGTIGYVVTYVKLGQSFKNTQQRKSHQQLALIVAVMMTFCMWLHWVCAYMH